MGLFTNRTERRQAAPPVDPPAAPTNDVGKKIMLNFRNRASEALRDMAAATLEAGGYVEPPPRQPEVGDTMPDGTKYAGISPDTGKPLYVTPADAPLTMKWQEAMDYAKKLGMRLPTKDELNVLFNNRAAIGGFDESGSDPEGWYWSASKTSNGVWCRRLRDGELDANVKGAPLPVRCVR